MKSGVSISGGSVFFGSRLTIPLSAFPQLLRDHLIEYPSTPMIEQLGRKLGEANFPREETCQFVREVCNWGGYPGIAGRILKNNKIDQICAAFRGALSDLNTGSVFKALCRVNAISGLGTPSFASKHLRFLRPDVCAVFDSILRDSLAIPFDPSGYHQFCADCAFLANALATNHISCPASRDGRAWFPADAEGALYIFARPARSITAPRRCSSLGI
jgi:hypothetical protein